MSDKLNLDAIKKRIAGLSKMTVENGCSEAEAMNAAGRLTALLDEHGLSMAEVEASAKEGRAAMAEEEVEDSARKTHESWMVANKVAELFDCVVIQARKTNGKRTVSRSLVFYGFPADAAAARALFVLIRNAMETEWRNWRTGRLVDVKDRAGFMLGMAQRIRARVIELKETRAATTGTALVVLKGQLVLAALDEEHGKIGKSRMRAQSGSATARAAGQAAGDRVALTAARGNIAKE